MTVHRVLRTAKATLARTFYLDEAGTDTQGSVAVAVTRLDGSAVQAGTASGPDADHVYTFTFQGSDVLDELVVTWSATVGGDAVILDQDRIQVAGGFYFGLAEGRAVDDVLKSTQRYPTADLVERRTETEDECELICGQAFVPRFHREVVDGSGRNILRTRWPWIRAVRSVTIGGVALAGADLAGIGYGDVGTLYRGGSGWPAGRRNIVIEYEHGRDWPPTTIVRSAKLRFKSLVLQPKSALPDRAERIAVTEMGVVSLATPDQWHTGIPEVDAGYAKFPDPRPGFG